MKYNIAVLPGDGIGPEVVEVALQILQVVEDHSDLSFSHHHGDVGGIAIDRHGQALPPQTLQLCHDNDAILFGSVGGKKWESLPPDEQPERAALLSLRKELGLYCNIRPITVFPQLVEASPLKSKLLEGGLEILIVRELSGGIYFSQPKQRNAEMALDTMLYRRDEIERIGRIAFELAASRKQRLCSIDKANVLESMVLWRETITELGKDYPSVELSHMYVDNAAMQLIARPIQFDVLLCSNLFGDILSDEAATLCASLGMLASASLSSSTLPCKGLYEPAGGSAPDIAGTNQANPIAQILSAALMIEYSFHRPDISRTIYTAVEQTLEHGLRTKDIQEEHGTLVSTTEMGNAIAERLKSLMENVYS